MTRRASALTIGLPEDAKAVAGSIEKFIDEQADKALTQEETLGQ